MKNTILKYSTEELDEFIVPDYFSKQVHIGDLLEDLKALGYVNLYRMTNNDKIERVSYELYGTTDYWDILLLLNSRDSLFGTPYDYESVAEASTNWSEKYINYLYAAGPNFISAANALREEYLAADVQENEDNRFIYVIKKNNLSDVIKIFKESGYL